MAERDSTGAAKRRRELRLRMHWRHEQLTLRMVLASVEHHSHGPLRGQTSATRTRAEERETYLAPRRQESLLPTGTGAQHFSMSDDLSVPVTGERPAALLEPPPQGRVLRHTVEQIADVCPLVQILNAPVPQTREQLVSFFKFLDTQMPIEQGIAVPKITKDMTQPRLVDCDLRQPQNVEQLAEVPTILYFLKQRVLSRSSTFHFRVVVGVRAVEVFLVFPQHRVQQHFAVLKVMEDPVEVFKAFPRDRVQQHFAVLKVMEDPVEVFKAFPQHRVQHRFAVLKVMEDLVVEVFKAFSPHRVPQRFAVVKMTEDLVEVFLVFPRDTVQQRFAVVEMTEDLVEVFKASAQLRVQRRLAELKVEVFRVCLRDRVQRRLVELKVDVFEVFTPEHSFQPSHELIAVTPAPSDDPQDFLPAQGSEAIFGGGRLVGGPQNFVPGQSSTEFGGADDDDELVRRSNELLEYTRREYLFSSDEEEEEEQPLRFQGNFRPRRFCLHFFQGLSCTFVHSYDELHPDVQW